MKILRNPFLWLFLTLLVWCGTKGYELLENARTGATASQVLTVYREVQVFRKKYGAWPGDLRDAGKVLKGCTGKYGQDCNPLATTAGNGIVGGKDFSKTFKSQVTGKTTVPATSEADETVLFWAHLKLVESSAEVSMNVALGGMVNGTEIGWWNTHPKAASGGGFMIAYVDGSPFPADISLGGKGMKGHVLVLLSQKALRGEVTMNKSGEQAITPNLAAQLDMKMDDGSPDTGNVQGYGAPTCFKKRAKRLKFSPSLTQYNSEQNSGRDCGLIFLMVIDENRKSQKAKLPKVSK